MKKKIILDVDTGTDDAVAIIAAALSPSLELMAVISEFGNNSLENTTRNTLQVIELLGLDIPVYAGCPQPMCRKLYYAFDAGQHKSRGVDKDGVSFGYHDDFALPPPVRKAESLNGVTYLIETLRRTAEKLTLVACGPLTCIGIALRIAPDIAQNIEEIVLMGGGINESNITLAAEANIWHDPEAAQIVMLAGVKTTVLPLDATHRAALPGTWAEHFAALHTSVGDFIAEMLRRRIMVYNALQPLHSINIAPIHDSLCVAYLLDAQVLDDLRPCHLDICLDHGAGAGALLVDTRHNHEPFNVQLAYSGDPQRLGKLLYDIVAGACR